MDPYLVALLGAILLFALLAVGVHIGIALAISGFLGITYLTGYQQGVSMCVTAFYHKISNPALITLPLFILMGYLASGGGISRNLFDSLTLWLGRFRGGLGIATVVGCSAFGTVCGSSVVTTAVFSKICAPEMRHQGYGKSVSYAVCASAGSIGMLIPPSIIAIVYGMLSGVSIGKVLMAGVAPGILWAVLFSLAIVLTGKFRPAQIPVSPIAATWGQRFGSLKLWWPIVIVAVTIFGGMYGGVFSPNEAAAVASFVLFVAYIMANIIRQKGVKRQQRVKEMKSLFTDTATTSALIFLVMGAATIFSNFIVLTGVATRVLDFISSWGLSKFWILFLFAFIYIILGCFLDSISMLCITIPVFNPIIDAAGIDPIWYATIVITSVEIGLITPPVGLNLYAAKGVAEPDVSLEDIIAGIFPFLAAEFIALAIIFSFPPISTFLPSYVG
jgi:tripartite ATP-independent transporter DctM subunit